MSINVLEKLFRKSQTLAVAIRLSCGWPIRIFGEFQLCKRAEMTDFILHNGGPRNRRSQTNLTATVCLGVQKMVPKHT